MIRLCLFDLDDTLVRTSDLEGFRGAANVGNDSPEFRGRLARAFDGASSRHLYTPDLLDRFKLELPEMKWGVFTRAPRAYAASVLQRAYPNWRWDVVVAREDVHQTKPHPDGVLSAMLSTGVETAAEVALVGDEKSDVLSAYRSGAWSIVDHSVWTKPRMWAMERVPDAVLHKPSDLASVLRDIRVHLPDLERRIATDSPVRAARHRFDSVSHIAPGLNGAEQAVTVLGRMFSNYASLRPRSRSHLLTQQIIRHKSSVRFPEIWIQSIRAYMSRLVSTFGPRQDWVVTAIPKKPDGVPRMESLLVQLALSMRDNPNENFKCRIHPQVFDFAPGVVPAHREHLTAAQRFQNIEKHLRLVDANAVRGRPVLIIDDVVTSGASLMCASRALTAAGATQVKCLALAKAVSDK